MTNKLLLEKWAQDLRQKVLPFVHEENANLALIKAIHSIEYEVSMN